MPTSPPILLLHGVTINSNPIEYDRYENLIYTNSSVDDAVIADYSYRPGAEFWPAYFVKPFMYELASVFASAIARKGDIAAHWAVEAQREYQRAKWADSSSQTARKIRTSTLVNKRR